MDSRQPPDVEGAYAALREAMRRDLGMRARAPHLIGVLSGGAWVAERLHADLALPTPLGVLSSAFHRDDYGRPAGGAARRGLPAGGGNTSLPFEVAGADLIVVDDILFTGRTVRACMNELFDYGRPDRIELAVLIDRGGRELPVAATWCGVVAPLPPGRGYVLGRGADGRFTLAVD